LGELNCSERRRRVVCGFGERGGKLQREREGHKHKERRRRRRRRRTRRTRIWVVARIFLCG
jgi:hypothetical protein